MSDREIGGIAVSLMFVLAAGYAPVRATASQEMEVVTFMDYRQHDDGDVVLRLIVYQFENASAADEAADSQHTYADNTIP
eukprot:1920868-Amphidinium_carterae.3